MNPAADLSSMHISGGESFSIVDVLDFYILTVAYHFGPEICHMSLYRGSDSIFHRLKHVLLRKAYCCR